MAWQVAASNRPDAADGRHHRKATVLEPAGAQEPEGHLVGATAGASRVPEAQRRPPAQLFRHVDGIRARWRVCVAMVVVSVVVAVVRVVMVVVSAVVVVVCVAMVVVSVAAVVVRVVVTVVSVAAVVV